MSLISKEETLRKIDALHQELDATDWDDGYDFGNSDAYITVEAMPEFQLWHKGSPIGKKESGIYFLWLKKEDKNKIGIIVINSAKGFQGKTIKIPGEPEFTDGEIVAYISADDLLKTAEQSLEGKDDG